MASIQKKIILASIAIFSLTGSAVGIGIWATETLNRNSAEVSRSAEILHNHMRADMMHDALRSDVLAAILSTNDTMGLSFDAVKADLAEHEATFLEAIKENAALSEGTEAKAVIGSVEKPLHSYLEIAKTVVGLVGSDPGAATKMIPDFMRQFTTLETAMEKAGEQIDTLSQATVAKSQETKAVIDFLLKGLLALATLFCVSLFILTRKTVTGPILRLSETMEILASGDTSQPPSGVDRKDEIGSMSGAVEIFRQAAIANRALEQEAAAAREKAELDQQAARHQAEEDASERLRIA
ncbi:MAG: HAMP domain-containing protein, partial [Rhizobium oryzihabitans]